MSNETVLGWLARNVYVWPVSTPNIVPAGDKLFEFGATFHQDYVDIYGKLPGCGHSIYRHQWLARRSELQNKPSWDYFGESAKFMAQDSDGAWMAFESEPAAKYHVWSSMRGLCGYAREGRDRCRGEVLGDWRDTLEKRPVDLSESAVTERLTEATQTVLAAAPALMDEKFRFDRDDWFERGELPPVGTRCVALLGIAPKANCEVIAKTEQQMVVKWEENGMMDVIDLDAHVAFRPVRTERDELIERMQSDIAERWANCEELATHLVDKGWVKVGK